MTYSLKFTEAEKKGVKKWILKWEDTVVPVLKPELYEMVQKDTTAKAKTKAAHQSLLALCNTDDISSEMDQLTTTQTLEGGGHIQ